MTFSREFIALVLHFAGHVAGLGRLPLEEAVRRFTPLYLGVGLSRDFERGHPVWQEFEAGLSTRSDLVEWAHAFCLARQPAHAVDPEPSFGCFYYEVWAEDRIRLHFRNAESAEHGPLSRARRPRRLAELGAMFRHLGERFSADARVIGGSWLYNIDVYRTLFPPAYLATAKMGPGEYQFMALWGQFLDRRGGVRQEIARIFVDRLARLRGAGGLPECFPCQVLRLESPLGLFREFYA